MDDSYAAKASDGIASIIPNRELELRKEASLDVH